MELEEAIKDIKVWLDFPVWFIHTGKDEDFLRRIDKSAIETLLNHITKQDKMIKKIHENFCKFDWKNSNGEEVHNQLKELYESIFKNEESE